MKRAIIGGVVFLLITATLLLLTQRETAPGTVSLRFVDYSTDTNGVKSARIVLLNSIDSPIRCFCTFTNPNSIGYFLNAGSGSHEVTNTLSATHSVTRLLPNHQLAFKITVPTNENGGFFLGVPFMPERNAFATLVAEVQRLVTKRSPENIATATTKLP